MDEFANLDHLNAVSDQEWGLNTYDVGSCLLSPETQTNIV